MDGPYAHPQGVAVRRARQRPGFCLICDLPIGEIRSRARPFSVLCGREPCFHEYRVGMRRDRERMQSQLARERRAAELAARPPPEPPAPPPLLSPEPPIQEWLADAKAEIARAATLGQWDTARRLAEFCDGRLRRGDGHAFLALLWSAEMGAPGARVCPRGRCYELVEPGAPWCWKHRPAASPGEDRSQPPSFDLYAANASPEAREGGVGEVAPPEGI